MDYKENYERLRKFIKDLCPHLSDYCKEKVEGFFSELKENEDEKMRRTFLRYVKSWQDGFCSWNSNKDFCNNAIAWLEKQGEKANPYSGVSFECNGDVWGMCERDNGVEILLNGQLFKYLEKQGESNKPKSTPSIWHDVTEEPNGNVELLCEWEGEQLGTWHDCAFYNTSTKRFLNGATVVENVTRWCYLKDLDEGQCAEQTYEDKYVSEEDEMVEEEEVKPSPRFKIGDWVVRETRYGRYIRQIVGMTNKTYALDVKGFFNTYYFEDIEDDYHLWTVNTDARDGDVLVCEGKDGQQEIGIFNNYVAKVGGCDSCFETYCFVDWEGNFRVGGYIGSPNIHPATNEQRDQLKKVMRENGHEWNADKKELKKVEQKPTDNVESKFSVGDWIIDYRNAVYQVTNFEDGYGYDLKTTDGRIFHFVSPDVVDATYRLWTVQDATDGQILVNGSNIFMFRSISGTRVMGYCHVNTDDGLYYDDTDKNECFGLVDDVITPANQDQIDLLYKRIKDAGDFPPNTVGYKEKRLTKLERDVHDFLWDFCSSAESGMSFDESMEYVHNLITLCKQDDSVKIKQYHNYVCTKTHTYGGVEWREGITYYSPEDYSLVNQGCTYCCPQYSKEEHNEFFKESKYK